jgi:hypothetical protein
LQKWKRLVHELIAGDDMPSEASFQTLYHATSKLAEEAIRARDRMAAGVSAPSARLGDCFERAVAMRTYQWLEQTRPRAVHSAWFDVKVKRNGQDVAQFDVLLVLKNGILWHLECKTFTTHQKDLDARLFTLQRAGSPLARMAVCVPLLTQHVGESWFARQQELRDQIETHGQPPYLPFTLPGQPADYSWPNSAGEPVARHCHTFEDGLAQLLRDYEPPWARVEA